MPRAKLWLHGTAMFGVGLFWVWLNGFKSALIYMAFMTFVTICLLCYEAGKQHKESGD